MLRTDSSQIVDSTWRSYRSNRCGRIPKPSDAVQKPLILAPTEPARETVLAYRCRHCAFVAANPNYIFNCPLEETMHPRRRGRPAHVQKRSVQAARLLIERSTAARRQVCFGGRTCAATRAAPGRSPGHANPAAKRRACCDAGRTRWVAAGRCVDGLSVAGLRATIPVEPIFAATRRFQGHGYLLGSGPQGPR